MINNEAHKRMLIPNYSDYSVYSTCRDGKWVLKTGNGDIIYTFKDDKERMSSASVISEAFMGLYRVKESQYLQHKRENPNYYIPTHEEANWVHRCLYRGFAPIGYQQDINPYQNWFGCSAYSPDRILKRENKEITLSLGGMAVKVTKEILDKYSELFKGNSIRYLCFKDGDDIVYETYTGKLPSMDFIEDFIK